MPKSKPSKIIIDTNLWISFIISNKLNIIEKLLISGKVRILFSSELIDEIQATITKPKLKKYFRTNALGEMLSAVEHYVDLVDVKSIVAICRDPKDDFLLALAKDGKADYLLTGDKDLLELGKFGKTKIQIISTFIEETKIL